jgi:ribonuclease HII
VTPEHNAALTEHGPCAEHRFSYINVANASGRDSRPPRSRRPRALTDPSKLGGEVVPDLDPETVAAELGSS